MRSATIPRIVALAAALLLAGGAGAAADPTEVRMTLREAVEHALEKNEDLVVEREALAIAEEAVAGARGAYDPQLQVDGNWRRNSPPVNSAFSGAPEGRLSPTNDSVGADVSVQELLPTGGAVTVRTSAARQTTDGIYTLLSPSYSTALGAEFRQPLLRGRALDTARLNLRVASAERTREAASLRREVSEIVAAVERAYWSLVAAREEVAVREEAVRLAEEQLSETKIRIERGASPESEEAQPRAELERRRGDLLGSRESVSRVENSLKLLFLADADADLWSRPIVPVDDAEVQAVELDLAAEMEHALRDRPELDAAAATRERRTVETRFARDEVRPSLDAVVSYDRFGFAGSANPNLVPFQGAPLVVPARLDGGFGRSWSVLGDGDFDDTRVGLVLTLPIGNRAARAAERSALSAERQAEADVARARKAVRAEVLDAAAALRTAYQRFEAARAEREAAEVQLGAEKDRFAVGLSTNFLVLTRQNDLARARLTEISSRTDYRTARTEMARSTGSLLKDRGIEVAGPPKTGGAR